MEGQSLVADNCTTELQGRGWWRSNSAAVIGRCPSVGVVTDSAGCKVASLASLSDRGKRAL